MPEPFAVCFSGHRPEKLPSGSQLRMLQSLLYREIETAVRDGADTFYTGMARGVDLWAADMVLHFRFREPERKLKLICVLPYEQQCARMRGAARYHVQTVLHAADETVCICRNYQKGCFTRRNQYMVDHSRRLIALVADTHSGTGQTIRMAERQGLELRVLNTELAEKQARPAHDFFYF
jgi:uncharacterized phage-like protein YoqJ